MKLYCLSDIHGDFGIIDRIKRTLDGHDLIVISGDITNFNSRMVATKMVDLLQSLGNVLLVPGNCDLQESLTMFEEKEISLHGQGKTVDSIGFFGVGGSNLTPFDTPFEISEDAITKFLNKGYQQIIGCNKKIMVAHAAPYGTKVDKTGSGMHAGSNAVYDFINQFDIDLVLCGHIHEGRGEDIVNDIPVLNIGPGKNGFVTVDIGDEITYEFVDY